MTRGRPPRVSTWLLKRLAAGRHGESLAGDLIEQYARGRSRLWYWRQAAMAILLARPYTYRTRTATATCRVFLHLVTELAVVLGATTLIDQSRHAQDWHDMLSPTFVATMTALMAIGLVSLWLRMRLVKSTRSLRAINPLIAFVAVAALGAGTLSWASSTHRPCGADACRCPQIEHPSVTSRGR
jgi:hypothetical protein